jgi:hypothetical protein
LRQLTAPLWLLSQTVSRGQHLSLWPFLPGQSSGRPFRQTESAPQVALPGVEVVPSGQSAQLVRPESGWKVPAGQAVHVSLPVVAAKDPAGHSGQSVLPELDWAVPAAQSVQLALPAVLAKDPGEQSVHLTLPGASAN